MADTVAAGETSDPRGHVVVVGDDRVGVRVLEELVALGVEVRGVSARADTAFARAAGAAEVPLVVGDPQSIPVLLEAGVAEARACGLVANSDLTNLHVALELEELAPGCRVALRLFNTALGRMVHGLVDNVTVLSAEEIAAPTFVEAALRGSADFRLRVGDRQMAVEEVDRDDPFCWLALADIPTGTPRPGSFQPMDAGSGDWWTRAAWSPTSRRRRRAARSTCAYPSARPGGWSSCQAPRRPGGSWSGPWWAYSTGG